MTSSAPPVSAGRGGFRGDSGYAEAGFGDFQDIFGDVFSDFFGGTHRRNTARKGADLRYDLKITFEEAAFGTEKKFKIPKMSNCSVCKGSRAKPGTSPVKCAQCNGVGQVSMQQGFFNVQRTCPACGGEGSTISSPCTKCAGTGKEQTMESLSIKGSSRRRCRLKAQAPRRGRRRRDGRAQGRSLHSFKC